MHKPDAQRRAEAHPSEMNELWLEAVLTRSLPRAAAPEELWDRIQMPRIQMPRAKFFPIFTGRTAWALTAALLAIALVLGFRPRNPAAADNGETLALNALRKPGRLEFQSGRATQIRAWVKASTGIDIPLEAEPSQPLRLTGAHLVKGNKAAVEIAYKIKNNDGVLLVSKPGGLADGHGLLRDASLQGMKVFSWNMRGQTFTLACALPGDLRFACLLCHASPDLRTILN